MGAACGTGASALQRTKARPADRYSTADAVACLTPKPAPSGAGTAPPDEDGAPAQPEKSPRWQDIGRQESRDRSEEATTTASSSASASAGEPRSARTPSSEVPEGVDLEDDESREICWIRGSFHIRDPVGTEAQKPRLRRQRSNSIPQSLRISVSPTSSKVEQDEPLVQRRQKVSELSRMPQEVKFSSSDEDPITQLIRQARKPVSLPFAGQSASKGPYFLSLADDVNASTLKRLVPTSVSGASHEDLRALVVFDWDDTLFPTSWCHRCFPHRSEYREIGKACVELLRAARQLGDVLIVTLATEEWLRECIDLVGDEEFSAEVAKVRIVYARNIQDTVQAWPRGNVSFEDSAQNFGVLLSSKSWDSELNAQVVNAKMAAMKSGLAAGCRQVISIGDSEIERWAVQDLAFVSGLALVKTIKFEGNLCTAALAELVRTTTGFLSQFVRLNVAMDINLYEGDALFPMDLLFAMQAAARTQDLDEPASVSPHSGRKRAVWRSYEL